MLDSCFIPEEFRTSRSFLLCWRKVIICLIMNINVGSFDDTQQMAMVCTHRHTYKHVCMHTDPCIPASPLQCFLNNVLHVNFQKSHVSTSDVTHLENSNEKHKDECLSWYCNRLGLLKHTLPVKLFKISHENLIYNFSIFTCLVMSLES